MVFTSVASGLVPIDQLTTLPSKQSITGRQIDFACQKLEPGNIGQPLLILSAGTKISGEEIFRCRTDFSAVRAVSSLVGTFNDEVADADASGSSAPKVVDGQHFLPQHRERIVQVGFQRDQGLSQGFTLQHIESEGIQESIYFHRQFAKIMNNKFSLPGEITSYQKTWTELPEQQIKR